MRWMAGTTDDMQGTREALASTRPIPAPPPAPPAAPAAERLSVIWLRDTKDKPARK